MARYVYIFQATKTATQSGRAMAGNWIAEFPQPEQRNATQASTHKSSEGSQENHWDHLPDAIMNWYGGGETSQQMRLSFPSQARAEAWAKSQGLTPIVRSIAPRRIQPKSYASNFAHDRPIPWTH